jgi:hypothetical protein
MPDVEMPPVVRNQPEQSSSGERSLTEAIVGISRRDPDVTVTDLRTGARGAPAVMAHAHVWTVLIVVLGFVVAIVVVSRAQHQDPPRRDTRGCIERVERTEHLEHLERSCELIDR